MGQLGVGVMLSYLGGNKDSVDAFVGSVGKTISAIKANDTELIFTFDDGTKMKLFDDGQSCCESRYMRTDDTLSDFVGAKLTGAEIKEAPEIADEYGTHEVEFLEVQTDKGVFTMSNHNEHNGYYGGFSIRAAIVTFRLTRPNTVVPAAAFSSRGGRGLSHLPSRIARQPGRGDSEEER